LGGIDAFGLGPFEAGGTSNTIDALTKGLGPSWRMVVDLGPTVKGYGIFPGGESGNPGSYFYDNLFQTWKEGKLKELTFMLSKDELPDSVIFTLKLN
jgi:penicillin amidase